MRNRLVLIPFALLTFLIGLTVHFVFHSSPSGVTEQNKGKVSLLNQLPLPVSTCDLQNAPEYFEGKRVRVEGILYGDFLLYGNCSDARNGPHVIAITFQGLDSHLNGLWGRLHGFPKGVKMELDVSVEGVVEYDPTSADGINITVLADDETERSPLRPFKLRGAA
jgi:hypothetical protein